jgi:hypothetical protein
MAPSFRPRSSQIEPTMATVDEGQMLEDTTSKASRSKVWERRRRRLQSKKEAENDQDVDNRKSPSSGRRRNKSPPPAEDQEDPYESDPGESYREHCMKFKGVSSKSCLTMPKFLRTNRSLSNGEEETVLTAPPSPMTSEMGDLFGQIPASLPPNLTRVRYSLRSSITDGSEKQPVGPSVMERRDLRPNGVHLNVSHWSDEGGRPYMEDRYVPCKELPTVTLLS